MKIPKGFKKFKQRAKIPVHVEGDKEPLFVIDIPEVEEAADLIVEMVEALETYSDACHKGYGRDIKPIDRVLKKFRRWK